MSDEPDAWTPENFRRRARIYLLVGAILFGGTALTAAVAMLEPLDVGGHGFDAADCVLGLLIAGFKATLVALVFMHLNHEKRWIYFLAGLAALHAGGMALLLALAESDTVRDSYFYGARESRATHLSAPITAPSDR